MGWRGWGAVSQEIYHVLGVAVVVGTARVSIAVILAVDHSALDSFLNLTQRGDVVQSHDSGRMKKLNKVPL